MSRRAGRIASVAALALAAALSPRPALADAAQDAADAWREADEAEDRALLARLRAEAARAAYEAALAETESRAARQRAESLGDRPPGAAVNSAPRTPSGSTAPAGTASTAPVVVAVVPAPVHADELAADVEAELRRDPDRGTRDAKTLACMRSTHEALARSFLSALDTDSTSPFRNDSFVSPLGSQGASVIDPRRLVGLLLDPRFLTDDEDGDVTLEAQPAEWLSLSAVLKRPELRLKVRQAFDDAQEQAALHELDVMDDATFRVQVALGRKPDSEVRRDAAVRAWAPAEIAEGCDRGVLAAPSRDWAIERYLREIDPFHLELTAHARDVDPLIAPRETGVSLSAVWERKREKKDVTKSFVLEGAYLDVSDLTDPTLPALDEPGHRMARVTAKFAMNALAKKLKLPNGDEVGLTQSLDVSFERPSSDYGRERVVATALFAFPLAEGITIPVTLTWANRPELVTGERVFGHVGVSYSFGKKSR